MLRRGHLRAPEDDKGSGGAPPTPPASAPAPAVEPKAELPKKGNARTELLDVSESTAHALLEELRKFNAGKSSSTTSTTLDPLATPASKPEEKKPEEKKPAAADGDGAKKPEPKKHTKIGWW